MKFRTNNSRLEKNSGVLNPSFHQMIFSTCGLRLNFGLQLCVSFLFFFTASLSDNALYTQELVLDFSDLLFDEAQVFIEYDVWQTCSLAISTIAFLIRLLW